ncbi:hypothetical protein [Bryobacter aggregatus]|uniref:hypothetical protein n=1 Tax=Bryobacter aggregatus TaxID=360054 RepID=UPI0004E0DE48|nr:hypothetical protein [Bryobacter aggregatus]
MKLTALLVMLMLHTKSSAQELFVFPDAALFTERDWSKLGCASMAAMQGLEAISPAVDRNAFFSLLLIVKQKPGEMFSLDAGQNPRDAFALRLYRYFPDVEPARGLVETPLAFRGRVAEGQSCAIFLLDAWVRGDLSPERVKLEPALWLETEQYWQRHPMEVRVLPEVAPTLLRCEDGIAGRLPSLVHAVAMACRPIAALCSAGAIDSLESLAARNLMQDLSRVPAKESCGTGNPGSVPVEKILSLRRRRDRSQ